MKYIVFARPAQPGLPPLPVLFPSPAVHADVARLFQSDGWQPVSAGFFDLTTGEAFGRSESLALGSIDGDASIIAVLGASTARIARANPPS